MTIFKGWQVLQIYNLYRVLLIICLVSYRYLDISSNFYNELLNQDAFWVLMMYAILVLCFIWCAHSKRAQFEKLLITSAFADLLFLNTFILYVGTLENGVGVLLNIAIAALAIMVPGLTSLFFAAFESIMMISYAYYQESSWSAATMFYAGIHGAGFFTTATTSLALAHWIKNINKVADLRRLEILSLQELNRHVIEKINAAIILVNQNLQLMFMNETAKKWLLMRDKSQSDPFEEISCELLNVVKKYFDSPVQVEEKHSLNECQKLLTIMPYGGGENSAAVLLIEDAKSLMAQAQQLKLASLGRFTASIAHELRNPLSAISHASQILANSDKLSDQEMRFNQIISKNCDRMNDLIKNVLQLSRQEPSKPVAIELNGFLSKFVSENKICQDLHVSFAKYEKHLSVLFDPSQLSQLLVILFNNAVAYGKGDDGKTLLHLSIEEKGPNMVRLRLCDEGAGIDESQRQHIFEPFYTTSRQGNGLGLFLAKELCTANKAKIELADNQNHRGACFDIYLLRQA